MIFTNNWVYTLTDNINKWLIKESESESEQATNSNNPNISDNEDTKDIFDNDKYIGDDLKNLFNDPSNKDIFDTDKNIGDDLSKLFTETQEEVVDKELEKSKVVSLSERLGISGELVVSNDLLEDI